MPDKEEMIEMAYWYAPCGVIRAHFTPPFRADQGKSFMHMYLCSYAEGGEPNMVITDRKKTPLAKRVLLTCSIS